MPFIRGRYHINPVAGEALEAAREAEAALLALSHDLRQGDREDLADEIPGPEPSAAKGPIHHVEIETAELVPAHSGSAVRGFVARVHRRSFPATRSSSLGSGKAYAGSGSEPETRAFTDHRDLLNFLREEFSRDCAQ
jgi:hypothetical protein